jgi:hypothetical protein
MSEKSSSTRVLKQVAILWRAAEMLAYDADGSGTQNVGNAGRGTAAELADGKGVLRQR